MEVVYSANGDTLAKVGDIASDLGFLTQESDPLQLAVFKFPEGRSVDPHEHIPTEKLTNSTMELWYVLSGRFEVVFMASATDKHRGAKFVLSGGQFAVTYAGFHSIRAVSEDAILMEVRNGPYLGKDAEINQCSQ